jgi:exopolyphosphatase / guanosine-5'-triphosphate,3'-diphosphate pyrophosphatase
LGAGLLERGALEPHAMQRTLAAIEEFMARVSAHDARVACIATSAMRRASNGAEFSQRVEAATGAEPQVLSGWEEAALSFAGATYGTDAAGDGRVAVLDIGGGSTEIAVGRGGKLESATSLEIGAVRLAERFPATMGAAPPLLARVAGAQARAAAAQALASLTTFAPVSDLRAVGGTPLALSAVMSGTAVQSASGCVLTLSAIDEMIAWLLTLDLRARRVLPGMVAQRADILPAGGLILSESLRALGLDSAIAEANDLLLGYLLRTGPQAAGG